MIARCPLATVAMAARINVTTSCFIDSSFPLEGQPSTKPAIDSARGCLEARMKQTRILLLASVASALLSTTISSAAMPEKATPPAGGKTPTVAEAKVFVSEAETNLLALAVEASRAG